MGFDIFWLAFKDGKPLSYPRRLIEDIFGLTPTEEKRAGNVREYSDGSVLEIYSLEAPEESSLMICRPPAALEFWDALFALMRKTSSMLVIPDQTTKFLVASPEVLPHLPPDLKGEIRVVSATADILAAIDGPQERVQAYVRQIVGDATCRKDP